MLDILYLCRAGQIKPSSCEDSQREDNHTKVDTQYPLRLVIFSQTDKNIPYFILLSFCNRSVLLFFYCFIFNVVRTLWNISSVSIYTTFFLMNSQVLLSHGQTNLHFILLSIYNQLSISRISRYLMISQVP